VAISGGQAVFAVVAKDAASKTLKGVGKAFGGLKRGGIAALKGIATASVAAATALVGFSIAAIKSAADDERATFRLNAALKSRGLFTEDLTKKINDQITAMAELGFTDDDVRAGIETGSRFFKNQERLLKVNAVAANIAAVTGKDLASVVTAIAKGAKGSTRGLLAFGIQVEKGAKLQDILRIATEKYGGAAQEISRSTSGRFAAAQIKLNEAFEAFGYRFLPVVNEALTVFTRDVLPQVERFLSALGPVIDDFASNYVAPLVDTFNDLARSMGFKDGFGFLIGAIELALAPLKVTLSVIKGLLDGINEAFKLFNSLSSSKTGTLLANNARTGYLSGGNLGMAAPMGGSTYLDTSIQFNIGTQKQDQLVEGALNRAGYERRYP
jgi:hypothetical protein